MDTSAGSFLARSKRGKRDIRRTVSSILNTLGLMKIDHSCYCAIPCFTRSTNMGEVMSTTKSNFVVALFLGLVISTSAAHTRITRIVIDRVESPTFGNASFGNVGQYEKLVGRAYGELDPRDEVNSGIVYIDKAPLNAAKRVEYSTDVLILKPIDMSRSN